MEDFGGFCARARRAQRAAALRAICTAGRPVLSLAPLRFGSPLLETVGAVETDETVATAHAGRKRARQGPSAASLLRKVEDFLGRRDDAPLRAAAPWSPRARRLRVPARAGPIRQAPHIFFVHDGAPGALARYLQSLRLPYSIDVCVETSMVQDYLRQWRAVYPETRHCTGADAGWRSDEAMRRRRSKDRSGVRIWERWNYCAALSDRNDVLVVEEAHVWSPWAILEEARARVVVVGCAYVGGALVEALPHLRERAGLDARIYIGGRRRGAKVVEPKLCPPRALFPSSQYVTWLALLADCVLRALCDLRFRNKAPEALRKDFFEFLEFWRAFLSASAYVEQKLRTRQEGALLTGPWEPERDGDSARFLRRWTTRAAVLAYCASPSSPRPKAAGLGAFFGDGLARACPECLATAPHSQCDWDPRVCPPAETTDRLLALRAAFVAEHVVRFTPPRALRAQQTLHAALGTRAAARKEERHARSEAGLMLLRTWALGLSLENGKAGRDQGLDAPFGFQGQRGGCLHLQTSSGANPFYSRRPGLLGAPVVAGRVGVLEALPVDAMADTLSLRSFAAHMARAHDAALRAALPFLLDFLAVDWCVLGCFAAFDRWSWSREITEVNVHPSCLLDAEKSELLRHVRFRWPNARIFWRAAENCPSALALDMIFR